MALLAIENGIDKLRINPGNIGSDENIKAVVEKAKEKNIPIRIGVNSGSIENIYLKIWKTNCWWNGRECYVSYKSIRENGFNDIVVSLKASNVKMMVEAYRK